MKISERHWRQLRRGLTAGYFAFALALVAVAGLWWSRYGQAPVQPIAFPHTTHAGRLGLPCTFCHADASRARQAGVPPVELCLSCHRTVATDRPEIRKLLRHAEEGTPIAWNRVHALPGFVYFPHKRHVRGGVDCTACHGRVAEMAVVQQVRSLKMGWCVTCHQAKGAPTDCWTCHM